MPHYQLDGSITNQSTAQPIAGISVRATAQPVTADTVTNRASTDNNGDYTIPIHIAGLREGEPQEYATYNVKPNELVPNLNFGVGIMVNPLFYHTYDGYDAFTVGYRGWLRHDNTPRYGVPLDFSLGGNMIPLDANGDSDHLLIPLANNTVRHYSIDMANSNAINHLEDFQAAIAFDGLNSLTRVSNRFFAFTDYGNHRIVVLTYGATLTSSLAQHQVFSFPEIQGPKGICYVPSLSKYFIANYDRHTIAVLDVSGTPSIVDEWGTPQVASAEVGSFFRPSRIKFTGWGTLLIVDEGNSRILEYTTTGSLIRTWGNQEDFSFGFQHPPRYVSLQGNKVYVTLGSTLMAGDATPQVQSFEYRQRVAKMDQLGGFSV